MADFQGFDRGLARFLGQLKRNDAHAPGFWMHIAPREFWLAR
jgi:hypothetical protein